MTDSQFYKDFEPIHLKKLLVSIDSNVKISGDEDCLVKGIASINHPQNNMLVMAFGKKNICRVQNITDGILIVDEDCAPHVNEGLTYVVSDNPRALMALAAAVLYKDALHLDALEEKPLLGAGAVLHKSVSTGTNVSIGAGTSIGAHTRIGSGVHIGANCRIGDNVTIEKSIIGNSVTIKSGARIGLAGFGFEFYKDRFIEIPHLGRVLIKDHVAIGSNTCIDRGVLEDTVIETASRIDNLVQIAHNVKLGAGCVLVSQVGIAGSTTIGGGTVLAGQAGVKDHLEIGKNVKIAAQSGVVKNIEDGQTVGGSPAVPIGNWHKQILFLSKQIKKKP